MHLKNVEIFCDVVSHRSFSRAAEVHQVAQSSASQAVNQLEKRLGAQLIDRSKRPLELTSAGQVYFDGCRSLLDGFRLVEDEVRRAANRIAGKVRVAAIYSVGLLQMGGYVNRFREQYPDTEIHLDYLHPDEVYERIQNDAADLGLVSFPKDGGEIGCIPWQQQEMQAVTAPGHPLAKHESLTIDLLADEPFVAFQFGLRIRRRIDRWLKQAKVAVNIVHEFDNVETIKRAVEVGAGISVLPEPTLRREIENGSLVAVPLSVERTDEKEPPWVRPLGIIHRRNKSFSTAAEKFIELLTSQQTADMHPQLSKTLS